MPPARFIRLTEEEDARLREIEQNAHLKPKVRLRAQPPLQGAPEASRVAADTLSRPTAHVRNPATLSERQPQNSLRDARARQHSDNPGYLLPRLA